VKDFVAAWNKVMNSEQVGVIGLEIEDDRQRGEQGQGSRGLVGVDPSAPLVDDQQVAHLEPPKRGR
jgi:hypothetical protein